MVDETNQTQSVENEKAPSQENDKAWDNPMLSRNALKNTGEGGDQEATEQKAEPETPTQDKPEAPKTEEDRMRAKASNMNILDNFADDAQFKPIAMYLDKQLADVDTERAFGKALEFGDTRLIDQAYLTEKLGDNAKEIIELSVSLFQAASAKAQKEAEAVYEGFGGKSVVDQAIKFFNEKGDPSERKALGALLDSGVKENIQYAMKQIVSFSKSAGGVASKSSVIPIGQPSADRGLSAAEYREAIKELTSKRGRATDADFERLEKARRLGIQQNL